MDPKDVSPEAQQQNNEDSKERQKMKLRGVLRLHDIFDGVDLPGSLDPGVVDVIVYQHGSKQFEIHSVNFLSFPAMKENDRLKELDKAFDTASIIALEKARNTPEELWTYELED